MKKIPTYGRDDIKYCRNKLLIIMQLSTVMLCVFFMSLSAGAYSQNERFTIKKENMAVKELLDKIESQSHYKFLYRGDYLATGSIKLDVTDAPLNEVLSKAFKETEITYKILDDNLVVIAPKTILNNEKARFVVTGVVTDATTHEPLPGTSIIVEGTTSGTSTDADGKYTLSLDNGEAVLVFSSIGYAPEKVVVEGRPVIDVALFPDITQLEDVVVIGYGTAKKKDLTGAVASIKFDDSPLQFLPNMNSLDLLKGRLPGLNIGTVNTAGGNPSISVRGQNSISANKNPLIILDGVVFLGSLNEINPSDIASVDVLKDASSAAVYGSKSANGVIMITTRKGNTEKPQFRMRATTGLQTYTNRPDMMNGDQFIQLKRDIRILNGASPSDLELNNLLYPKEYQAYQEGHTVNWFDAATRVAPVQDYQGSVTGGSKKFNYYASGQYINQKGIVEGDQFKKFIGTVKLETSLTHWMKYGVNVTLVYKNADGVAADMQNATISSPWGYMNSTFSGYENRLERFPSTTSSTSNPLWRLQVYNEDRNTNLRTINYLKIDVPGVEGLNYTVNYSLNRWDGFTAEFNNENTFVNTLNLAELQDPSRYLVNANGYRAESDRTDWYLSHVISYNRVIADDHALSATLLAERQHVQERAMEFYGADFSSIGTTVLGVNGIEYGNATRRDGYTNSSALAQLAYMARIGYVYKDKYHLTGSIRRDGYSGFAEGNKYGDFRAVGLAWTLSEESFIKDALPMVDHLKLRGSLGENGNPSIGAYSTFAKTGSGNYLFGTTPARTVTVAGLANRALKWEKTTALDFGFDFTLFKNKLSGTIDYYNSYTTNLLFTRAIPIMNGFGSVADNIGKINNKGLEAALNATAYKGNTITWETGVNFWMNRNKVIRLYGLDGDGDGKEDDDIANNIFIGKSLGAIYDYTKTGIVQQNDYEYIATYGAQPGDVKFKDIDGNGVLDAKDRSVVGYSKPNFNMNFSNTIRYKNFELYFLVGWAAGGGKNNYYMATNTFADNPNTYTIPGIANWLNKPYWTPDHPSNDIPRPNYTNTRGYRFSERQDFVRLQDVSLSYRFADKILQQAHLINARLFISAKNLLTFTNWEGLDPETATPFGMTSSTGFPVMKTVMVGVEVNF